jgi:hypothetical protein
VTTIVSPVKGVSILLGTGTGNFGPPTSFGQGPGELDPRGLAVGDFNGDGHADLAVTNTHWGNVAILLGTGTGSFGARTDFGVGGWPTWPVYVAVGDFNGDGRQDLVVGSAGSNTVSILLGDGTGSFGAATNVATGSGVAVGDFNGDGRQDLVATNGSSNTVSVLLGDGTGSFGAATSFVVGTAPTLVAVGDFNGDGELDLAVTNNGADSVSVLLGNGTGSFGAATNFVVGTAPVGIAVGDFNGDGQLDLAVANNGSNSVSILLNNCQVTAPPVGGILELQVDGVDSSARPASGSASAGAPYAAIAGAAAAALALTGALYARRRRWLR